ncbi:aminotransferase class I and II [Streptomyces viridochromogenes DSM 40736]|uniref:Aminotransferase n=1 Tax=Streptomyces viridochromogenes (strain DSM 40736 / JCM 4977 / BCRC 1201 / Tue 494) TaxID=591159 RepID=D9XAD9_STRVT|nr:aspartate transaminase [Streptomyces viridochromogenes]EFL30076.1 aminotransferase class I and II [Streptomyces viridochromogenes DSM 40736]
MDTAERVRRIKPSPSTAAAQRVRELKGQGLTILDLTVGEPDFDTPDHVKAAAIRAIEAGETKYTPVNGTPRLRAAIAGKLRQRHGLEYTDRQITVGGGAKQVIFLALAATLDAGDEVVVPAPYWVSYPDMVLANDGTPVIVDCPEADGFKLTPGRLRSSLTERTRWVVLNTPGNPTGAAYTPGELQALAEVLLDHPHVRVLTDEIYDEIWYDDGDNPSLAAVEPRLSDRVFLTNGVSKTYAMTGWRIGYGAGPADLVTAINTLQSQSSSCPSSVSQAAAAAALTGPQDFVRETVDLYRARRDTTVKLIADTPGLSCTTPSGGFYLLVDCRPYIGKFTPAGVRIENDEDFARHLLESRQVAVIHGAAYGAPGYFRISFATSTDILTEACARITAACASLSERPS